MIIHLKIWAKLSSMNVQQGDKKSSVIFHWNFVMHEDWSLGGLQYVKYNIQKKSVNVFILTWKLI